MDHCVGLYGATQVQAFHKLSSCESIDSIDTTLTARSLVYVVNVILHITI